MLICSLLIADMGAAIVWSQTRPATERQQDLRSLAQKRVEAARRALDAIQAREDAGEALSPSFVELKGTWHRRLFEARADAAKDRDERVAAAREYVEQRRRESAPSHAPPLYDAMLAFYVAEAEYQLAMALLEPGFAERAQARVNAAERVVEELAKREDAGEVLSPTFIELRHNAHRRLFEARLDAAKDRNERRAAAKKYLDYCFRAQDVSHRPGKSLQQLMTEYYRAEAEYLIAKMEIEE
jgi:hypothetical protein